MILDFVLWSFISFPLHIRSPARSFLEIHCMWWSWICFIEYCSSVRMQYQCVTRNYASSDSQRFRWALYGCVITSSGWFSTWAISSNVRWYSRILFSCFIYLFLRFSFFTVLCFCGNLFLRWENNSFLFLAFVCGHLSVFAVIEEPRSLSTCQRSLYQPSRQIEWLLSSQSVD